MPSLADSHIFRIGWLWQQWSIRMDKIVQITTPEPRRSTTTSVLLMEMSEPIIASKPQHTN